MDEYERRCDGCGVTYDIRRRGVSGPFHFRVLSAQAAGDEHHRLVGHWRSGVWKLEEWLVLLRPDGHEVSVRAAELEEAAGTAGSRGQAVLTVEAEQPESVQPGGCVLAR